MTKRTGKIKLTNVGRIFIKNDQLSDDCYFMMDIEIEDNSQLQDTFVFTLLEMVELFNRFEIEWLEDFKGLKIQFTKNINVCGVLRSPDHITYIGQSIVLKGE